MHREETHLSDREILLALDGELPARDRVRVEAHLPACWTCRVRKREMEDAIAGFIGVRERNDKLPLPAADGPRALLKARLERLAEYGVRHEDRKWRPTASVGIAVAVGLIIGFSLSLRPSASVVAVSIPNHALTPGATLLVDREAVCRLPDVKNRAVPLALQHQVFAAYGIAAAEPRRYEVDYLITPALGGAEDIHNLWPQSYSGTMWNAQVKDELEDYLRESVCEGKLDLATAQRDVGENWIQAYKKYFRTDKPLVSAQ